jgi:hypothetical protein
MSNKAARGELRPFFFYRDCAKVAADSTKETAMPFHVHVQQEFTGGKHVGNLKVQVSDMSIEDARRITAADPRQELAGRMVRAHDDPARKGLRMLDTLYDGGSNDSLNGALEAIATAAFELGCKFERKPPKHLRKPRARVKRSRKK